MPLRDAGAVIEELQRTEAGRALAQLAERQPGLWVVGGAVRDVLLGRRPRELDVVVEGDALAVARELAAAAGRTLATHPNFGTASVIGPDAQRIDLVTARREEYPEPGALPQVIPGTLEEDLARRDFSVNAIAVAAGGSTAGELRAVPHALDDLAAGRLRVLHEASFIDDPTRMLRLARYAARLTFDPEEHTRLLVSRAVRAGALLHVSGARLGAELRLTLAEDDPMAALGELARLGLLRTLHPRLRLDRDLVAPALDLLPADGRVDVLLLSAISLPLALSADPLQGAELRSWLDRLEFPAGDRDRTIATVTSVPALVAALGDARPASEVRASVGSAPPEAVALAGAMGPHEAARRWLAETRHVRLEINGDDLLAAGIAPGPEIGRRLAAALDQRLDGTLAPGRAAELRAALDATGRGSD